MYTKWGEMENTTADAVRFTFSYTLRLWTRITVNHAMHNNRMCEADWLTYNLAQPRTAATPTGRGRPASSINDQDAHDAWMAVMASLSSFLFSSHHFTALISSTVFHTCQKAPRARPEGHPAKSPGAHNASSLGGVARCTFNAFLGSPARCTVCAILSRSW